MAAWVTGGALALGGSGLPSAWPLVAGGAVLLPVVMRAPRAWLAIAALVGALGSTYAARLEFDHGLPRPLEGKTLAVTGRVTALVRHERGRVRFYLAV